MRNEYIIKQKVQGSDKLLNSQPGKIYAAQADIQFPTLKQANFANLNIMLNFTDLTMEIYIIFTSVRKMEIEIDFQTCQVNIF